jgi:large subunit ribosomal protein L22
MKAISRTIRITPKKLNLVAEMIRLKDANEAMNILELTPKKAAKILQKTLKSAVSNATNNFKQTEQSLYVKEVVITKAPVIKRFRPASRGRSMPILKRNAHLAVTLGVKEEQEKKKEVKTTTKKTTTVKAKRTTKQ